MCVCDPGFVSDGENNCIGINNFKGVAIHNNFPAFHVTDVNECAASADNCDLNAICTNTVGSFTCTCRSSFFGNGISCESKLLSYGPCQVAKFIGNLKINIFRGNKTRN